jgi:uncharacterized protein
MSKHIPTRMCVVCREKDNKRTLHRIVRTQDGVMLDNSGKLNGRGAYLCDSPTCWQRAVQSEVLAKALRSALSDADRERLSRVAL